MKFVFVVYLYLNLCIIIPRSREYLVSLNKFFFSLLNILNLKIMVNQQYLQYQYLLYSSNIIYFFVQKNLQALEIKFYLV